MIKKILTVSSFYSILNFLYISSRLMFSLSSLIFCSLSEPFRYWYSNNFFFYSSWYFFILYSFFYCSCCFSSSILRSSSSFKNSILILSSLYLLIYSIIRSLFSARFTSDGGGRCRAREVLVPAVEAPLADSPIEGIFKR